MNDRLQFGEVYSRLANDDLARIALANHLVPEAQEALTVELQRRGLVDLSRYKGAQKETAAGFLVREPAVQAGLERASGDRIFVFAAWVLAVSVPLVFLFAAPPTSAGLMLCPIAAVFIAISCYRGLKARRDGSRKGFVLKFVLPLILLCMSTTVVLSSKLLGLSL
jgi:hypothetical protein